MINFVLTITCTASTRVFFMIAYLVLYKIRGVDQSLTFGDDLVGCQGQMGTCMLGGGGVSGGMCPLRRWSNLYFWSWNHAVRWMLFKNRPCRKKCILGDFFFKILLELLNKDVSFPAFAGIPAFMKSKSPYFYLFSACFWRLSAQIHSLFQAFSFMSAYILD